MTHLEAIDATHGVQPAGFVPVGKIETDTKSVHAWVSANAMEMAVAFNGTLGSLYPPSKDWLENLRIWKKSFSVGTKKFRAMAGFVEEYLEVREEVLGWLAKYPSVNAIHISGYSQGGAHATLFWRDLVANRPDLVILGSVYASPRVYDIAGALEFESKVNDQHHFERIELHGDPVPHLPPWWLLFRHVKIGRAHV